MLELEIAEVYDWTLTGDAEDLEGLAQLLQHAAKGASGKRNEMVRIKYGKKNISMVLVRGKSAVML